MSRSKLLKAKNLFVDGVTKEISKAVSDRMWDAYETYRDREKLATCVSALTGMLAYLGGAKNWARIIAAAIRDPEVSPASKANLLSAIIRMQVVVDTEKTLSEDARVAKLTDAELATEFQSLTRSLQTKRGLVVAKLQKKVTKQLARLKRRKGKPGRPRGSKDKVKRKPGSGIRTPATLPTTAIE